MSFRERETSRYHGKPINLFQFKYGSDLSALASYTDAENPVTWNGILHDPITIKVSKINESGTLDRKQLTVEVPITTTIAQQFAGYPPSYPISAQFFQGHLSDGPNPEFLAFWIGRVISSKNDDDNRTQLICEPMTTALSRVGLRRKWQYTCGHALYSQGDFLCNASKAAATLTITPMVGSVGGNSFKLPNGWASDPVIEQFQNGIVEWATPKGTEIRTIRKLETVDIALNTRIWLDGPTTDLLAQQVKVIKGCPHNEEGCSNIHNNINNFGGDSWIPSGQPLASNKNYF